MSRRVCIVLFISLALFVPGHVAVAAPCWRPPVAGRVVDGFRQPPCPYCAGNRGMEYGVAAGTRVSAVASGVVTWAGSIADTRYVVVQHGDGWRITYGRLDGSSLRQGDRVARGASIGTASGEFYFGLRVGEVYRDPAPYLGRMVGRPRLVPVDGSRAHRAPAPRLRCGA